MHHFDQNRLGVQRDALVSTCDFPVCKLTKKHPDVPVRRLLGTTKDYVVERDTATYNTVCVYNLQDVYALIRCEDDAQKFLIEYKEPHAAKMYTSPSRDPLLAHIVDACRTIGNTNVSVTMTRIDRGNALRLAVFLWKKKSSPLCCAASLSPTEVVVQRR